MSQQPFSSHDLDIANMRMAGVSEERIQAFMRRQAVYQQQAEYVDRLDSLHKHTGPIRELMRRVGRLRR